jgi:hypothetical protein
MSKERSFSAGDRSFSARRPVVLHASMAGSSGVCALADAASMRVSSEYVKMRMIDSYSWLAATARYRDTAKNRQLLKPFPNDHLMVNGVLIVSMIEGAEGQNRMLASTPI